jgi:histidinol-phosphate aminotransferase
MESNPKLEQAVTRRGFLRGAGAALAVAPMMTEARLAWAAQSTKQRQAQYSGRILLDANENPLGPCDSALDAIQDLGSRSGRYDFPASVDVANLIRMQEGLKEGYLALYAGSSEPLQYAVMAFTSPGHGLVCANPTYEAPGLVAAEMGVPIHTVGLRKDYAHDVHAMLAADPMAGCFYICNPNNPSGTVTTREDIYWLLQHKPKHAVVVVDEAYIHYSDAKTVLDYAQNDCDLIVLRSFSKIYGMAGLRFGFAVARPDLLARLERYGMNPLSLPGVVAARASLMDKTLVPTRKAANAQLRDATIAWLKSSGYSTVPSQANFFMVDVKRPGDAFAKELAKRDVYIGRSWPIWPNHVRVTVGTANEMQTFQEAFADVAGIYTRQKSATPARS